MHSLNDANILGSGLIIETVQYFFIQINQIFTMSYFG
jgi:hypothetical protein